LDAETLQPLSRSHSEFKQSNCPLIPRAASIDRAMDRGSPLRTGAVATEFFRGWLRLVAVGFGVGRGVAFTRGLRITERLAAVVLARGTGAAVGVAGVAGVGAGLGGSASRPTWTGSSTAGRRSAAGAGSADAAGRASLPPPTTSTIAMPAATVAGSEVFRTPAAVRALIDLDELDLDS
jgi:hypothetical protein